MTRDVAQIAQVVALAGLLLLVVEYISTLLMLPWTFRFGLPIVRRELHASSVGVPADSENAVVKQVSQTEWVFRHKFPFFGFQSPFPIRGSMRRTAQRLTVVGTQPVGGALFLLGWAAFMRFPVGPLLAAAMYLLSWLIEQARFERAWQEVSKGAGPRHQA